MTHGALTVSVAMYSVVNVPSISMHGVSSAPELDTSTNYFLIDWTQCQHVCIEYSAHTHAILFGAYIL